MGTLDLTGIGEAASAAKSIIGMFFPDKTEEEKARLAASLAIIQGQLEVNKAEAQNPSMFVAGGRPAVIWVAAIALALAYWPKALVLAAMWTYQASVVLHGWSGVGPLTLPAYPDLGITDLIGLLLSLLGVSTLRSIDKANGVDTKAIAPRQSQQAP